VEQANTDKGHGKPGALTSEERAELSGLRKRVRQLEMERDLLKNAAVHSIGERNGMCSSWLKGRPHVAGEEARTRTA
jgi:transposase-like protein